MDSTRFEQVVGTFPFLANADPLVRAALHERGRSVRLPAGAFICMEGAACGHLALVINGHARVYKTNDSGREITLYRLHTGDSCILTASCILSDQTFPAFAVAETEVEAWIVPAPTFRQWVQEHVAWQQYVFGLLSKRLARVIEVVEDVTFRRLDARLATHLLDTVTPPASQLKTTHEALAAELGSSREVISRLLKHFEQAGWVTLRRGVVELVDRPGLQTCTEKTP
ncbi:MAG: Crp/Fnr family transcriptional regulator [Bacteroidota bacterium]